MPGWKSPSPGGARRLRARGIFVSLVAALTVAATGLLGLAPAFASVPSSQLVFYDNRGDVNSIYISGPNQNGIQTGVCWATPGHTTTTYNWWWANRTYVTTFNSSNCTGGHPTPTLWISPDGGTQYRCLIDTSPYSDWDCPNP